MVALAFWGMRRRLGRDWALLLALACAALPVHIVYSRFGWDSSHTPLVMMCVCAALLARRWILAILAAALALWVHPTNVLGLTALGCGLIGWAWSEGHLRRVQRRHVLVVAGALVPVVAAGVYFLPSKYIPTWELVAERLDPEYLVAVFRGWGRLMNGVTPMTYIAGPPSWTIGLVMDLVFWAVAFSLLGFGLRGAVKAKDGLTLGLVIGIVAALLAVLLLGGPAMFSPEYHRYTMSLTVPTLIGGLALLSRALAKRTGLQRLGVTLLCTGALVAMALGYFKPLLDVGGYGLHRFRTAQVEPKCATYRYLLEQAADSPVHVVAEGWWDYAPIEYLTHGDKRIQMEIANARSLRRAFSSPEKGWFLVGFPGGPMEQLLRERGVNDVTWSTPQASGEPIILVWRLAAPP